MTVDICLVINRTVILSLYEQAIILEIILQIINESMSATKHLIYPRSNKNASYCNRRKRLIRSKRLRKSDIYILIYL